MVILAVVMVKVIILKMDNLDIVVGPAGGKVGWQGVDKVEDQVVDKVVEKVMDKSLNMVVDKVVDMMVDKVVDMMVDNVVDRVENILYAHLHKTLRTKTVHAPQFCTRPDLQVLNTFHDSLNEITQTRVYKH